MILIDVNECESSLHQCGEGQLCVNLPGSYRCECQAGYQYDSFRRMCTGVLSIIHVRRERILLCQKTNQNRKDIILHVFTFPLQFFHLSLSIFRSGALPIFLVLTLLMHVFLLVLLSDFCCRLLQRAVGDRLCLLSFSLFPSSCVLQSTELFSVYTGSRPAISLLYSLLALIHTLKLHMLPCTHGCKREMAIPRSDASAPSSQM